MKTSLILCEKNLKKWPGNLQINALKSLALWYSGLENQASCLAVDVAKNLPDDYFTISIIEKVLEFTNNFELIVTLCENFLKFDYDVRIAEQLYFACLKIHDTKKLYAVKYF